jgi:Tol biopolymer transport system component
MAKTTIPVFLVLVVLACGGSSEIPVIEGPYLGQKPPGDTPEIFAPGIVSTGHGEIKAVFSPDGREMLYQIWGAPFPVIVTMEEVDGRWTKPRVASFSGRIIEGFNISPDGRTIVLTSHAPLDGKGPPLEEGRIRFIEKRDGEWGGPRPLNPSIRGYPAIAENGNLYLATGDIWLSEYRDGEYSEMMKLGDSINTEEFYEEDLFIAPDESYLLFCRRDDGFGAWDIFVSYRRDDGSWTEAKNLGETINTSATEVYPFVSRDGKYLFFGSNRRIHEEYSETPLTYAEKLDVLDNPGNGNTDIYWVDASIIQALKPKGIQ